MFLLKIKSVNPKGCQSWVFVGRTDAEAEAPILGSPDGKNWLIRKDPDAVKDWRQEEKGMTEDEMVGWHHQLNGHELEQAPGVGDGQGGLVCCRPWGRKQSDTTEWLNWTELLRECCMYQWTASLLICLRSLSQKLIISCALIGTNSSPHLFSPAGSCNLPFSLLTQGRCAINSKEASSISRESLTSFGGGLPFIIYG